MLLHAQSKKPRKVLAALLSNNFGGSSALALLDSSPFYAQLTKSLVLNRGTGSPTFTRATTKTGEKYDPAGNLLFTALSGEAVFSGARRVRNYAVNTGDLTVATGGWSVSNATSVAGATDPDGGTTAYTITATGANGVWYRAPVVTTGRSWIDSVYIKRKTGTGTVKLVTPDNSAYETVAVTSSWARYSTTVKSDGAGNAYIGVQLATSGDAVDVWHPQLEDVTGHSASHQVAGEYVSVGVLSAPYHGSGVDGVKCFDTDIDGNPLSSAQLKGYSAEPAATNLCLQSQTFGTAPWTPVNATVSADSTVAPDGTTTADSLVEDATAAAAHLLTQAITKAASSSAYTFSVSAKKAGRDWIALTLYDNTALGARAWFNVNTGVVGSTANIGAGMGAITATMTAQANGFYRCTMSVAASGTATRIDPYIYSTNADSVINVNGLNAVGLYLLGAQLETGSVATSYIPTTTTAVTRNADVLKYPSAGNYSSTASWISASVTMKATASDQILVDISNDANNRITTYRAGSGGLSTAYAVRTTLNNFTSTTINSADPSGTTQKKVGFSFGTVPQAATNGVAGTATTLTNAPYASGATIGIGVLTYATGTAPANANFKDVRIGQRALSNSELKAVTS